MLFQLIFQCLGLYWGPKCRSTSPQRDLLSPQLLRYLMLTLSVLVYWSGSRSNLPVLVSLRRPGPTTPTRFR